MGKQQQLRWQRQRRRRTWMKTANAASDSPPGSSPCPAAQRQAQEGVGDKFILLGPSGNHATSADIWPRLLEPGLTFHGRSAPHSAPVASFWSCAAWCRASLQALASAQKGYPELNYEKVNAPASRLWRQGVARRRRTAGRCTLHLRREDDSVAPHSNPLQPLIAGIRSIWPENPM